MRRTRYQAVPVLLLCFMAACAGKNYVQHPGSANVFDSNCYDALRVADDVIQSVKKDLAATPPVFPPSVASAVKTAVNQLIKAYDIANVSYQAYHVAALAGTSTPGQVAELKAKLADVSSAQATLATTKAGQ